MSPISGDTISIICTEYVQMKEGNMIKPFVFVKLDKPLEFRFAPQYNPISAVLGKAVKLWKADKEHPRDRVGILNAIAHGALRLTSRRFTQSITSVPYIACISRHVCVSCAGVMC